MKHVNVDAPVSATATSKNDTVFEQLEQNAEYAQQQIAQNANIDAGADDASSVANKDDLIAALKEIYDPEIPINIYDLGLIYHISIVGRHADIDMTLTTPGCPVAHSFPGMVENTVTKVAGIDSAKVELVWDPPWTQESLTDEARLQLGLM